MNGLGLLFFLFVFVTPFASLENYSPSEEKLLQLDLFKNYDPDISPNQENRTTVGLGIFFGNYEYQDESGQLNIQCFIRPVWKDNRLTWNSTEKEINGFAPEFEIWRPHIIDISDNGFDGEPIYYPHGKREKDFNNRVQSTFVRSDGQVMSVYISRLTAKCVPDLMRWPKDSVTCEAFIGSEAISNLNLTTLTMFNQYVLSNHYMEAYNEDWVIKSHNEKKLDLDTPNNGFDQIIILKLVLETSGNIFSGLLILPGIALAVSTTTMLLLNCDNMVRLVILEISFIIHTYLLQILAFHIPSSGSQPPYMVKYFFYSLLLTGLVVVETISVKSLSSIRAKSQTATTFLTFLDSCKSLKLFMIPRNKVMNKQEGTSLEDSSDGNDKAMDEESPWKVIALFVDRFLFCLVILSYSFIIVHFLLF